MNIIAGPNAGKSWLAGDLTITLASGRDWFDIHLTTPRPVLLIDHELHKETVKYRPAKVRDASRVQKSSEFAGKLRVE